MIPKAIIFDWGRTLYDHEDKSLFPGVPELLDDLSKKYKLALVSLVGRGTIEEREQKIEASGIKKYFNVVGLTLEDKDKAYQEILEKLKLKPEEVVVVDDRVIRGIRWGNLVGAITVWLEKGKFSYEKPNQETGAPTYTIHDLSELRQIL